MNFPNGSVDALSDRLADLLANPEALDQYRPEVRDHLARHKADAVARAYLRVLNDARKP